MPQAAALRSAGRLAASLACTPRCQQLPSPNSDAQMFPGEHKLPVENRGPGRSPGLFPGSYTCCRDGCLPQGHGQQRRPDSASQSAPRQAQPATRGVKLDGLPAGTSDSEPVASTMTSRYSESPRQNGLELGPNRAECLIFQGIHNSLCQDRRQCAFATHWASSFSI